MKMHLLILNLLDMKNHQYNNKELEVQEDLFHQIFQKIMKVDLIEFKIQYLFL